MEAEDAENASGLGETAGAETVERRGPLYSAVAQELSFSHGSAREVPGAHGEPCLVKRSCAGEVFRTDAKAEGDEVALGGWRCEGGVKPGEAEWFAIKITRDNAPGAYTHLTLPTTPYG